MLLKHQDGGFVNGTKRIYYYAGVWTCIDYKTLKSHETDVAIKAFNWLNVENESERAQRA